MRIFTLGRKGIPLFFFALFLMTGTSMYGQQGCPTADGTPAAQTFCYLETVGDIETDGTAVYRNPDSRQPAPPNQLLETRTYYIGSSAGDCTDRIAVSVTVNASPAPQTEFGNVFAPCIESEENLHTVADLEAIFEAETGFSIVVFENQFGMDVLAETESLEPGQSYFVGQEAPEECASLRIAIAYNPDLTEAPTAQALQTFCLGATVADLEAEGTSPNTTAIRWYSDNTSFPPLDSDMQLLDGETYYASQIINDRNSPVPPCESDERVAVTVEIIEVLAGEDNTLTICQSALEARLVNESPTQVFLSLLEEDVPTNGSFNPTINQLANRYSSNPLDTFATTYTVTNELGCEDSVDLTLIVEEDPNAGEDVNEVFCQSEIETLIAQFLSNPTQDPQELFASWIGERDIDGTFSGDPLQSLVSQFTTNSWPIEVSTTYTVGEGLCEDTAEISITITETQTLEETYSGEICNAGLDERIDDAGQVRALFLDLLNDNDPQDGTFSPTIPQIINQYENNPNGSFTTIYTVGEGNCQDSAELTITIVEPIEANAGEIQDIVLGCEATEIFVLDNSILGANSTPGGTFSAATGVLNSEGNFDPSIGTGEYEVMYSVTDANDPCITGSANTTFTIFVTSGSANAGSDNSDILCNAGLDERISDIGQVRDLYINLLDEGVSTNGTFNPTLSQIVNQYEANNIGDFTTTYTVGEGDCQDSALLTITVVAPTQATVNDIANFSICSSSDDLNLFEYLNIAADFGEFSTTDGALENGNFNISSTGITTITYTVNEDNAFCVVGSDFTTFEVEVLSSPNAGENAIVNLDADDTENVNLFDALGGTPDTGGTWTNPNQAVVDATFDPTTETEGAYTYTVSNDNGCEASATVTVVIQDIAENCPEITNPDQSFCPGQATVADLFPSNVTWYATADSTVALDEDTELEDGEDYFAGNAEGTCTVRSAVIVSLDGEIAGSDNLREICNTGLDEGIDDIGQVRALFLDLLDPGVLRDGTFNPSLQQIINRYEANNIGDFTTTYTVNEGDCQDSTVLTLRVVEGDFEAGQDNSIEICQSEIDAMLPNVGNVRDLYLDLLDEGISRTGSFSPTIQSLADRYNSGDQIGDFVTIYTVGDGVCADSVELTVTVLENPDAGQSATVNLEEDATDTVDLFDELGGTPEEDGTWTFDGEEVDGTFDPTTDEEGAYTYTVTSDNGCSASATVTVIIGTEEPNCPEVTETEQTFCGGTPTVADLAPTGVQWYSSADGTEPLETTTALVDGNVYFAGPVDGTCDDRPSVTVTLSDNPAAPTVVNFTDCVVTGATVADLDITGEDGATFEVFTDEALNTPVTDTEVLVEGTYYVTQTNAEGCVSEAAMITVTLDDASAPTITADGNVFCEFDGATIAELEENITATGTITWYTTATGMQTVPQNTVLQNNTTYYAATTDATIGCESSQRLAVTVMLEVCEIVIPELFSPNGDRVNDTFVIQNVTSEYPNHNLEIYNRWGELVFKGQAGEGQGWDGTSSEGSLGSGVLPAGVYFYILYFNDGQTSPTQGRLYLSR